MGGSNSTEVIDFDEYLDKGVIQCNLSSSLWTASLLLPMLLAGSGTGKIVAWVVPIVTSLVLIIFVQVFFIAKVFQAIFEETDFVCTTPVSLVTYLCVGCFALSLLAGDLGDSFAMLSWIRQIPETPASERFAKNKCLMKLVDRDGIKLWRPAFGMTMGYRVAVIVVLIMGRLALAIALLVTGSGFIVTTDSVSGQILNACAMVFIEHLDDLAYEYVTPGLVKNALSQLPPLGYILDPDESTLRVAFMNQFGAPLCLAALFVLTLLMVQVWCAESTGTVVAAFGGPIAASAVVFALCGIRTGSGWDLTAEFRNKSGSMIDNSVAKGPGARTMPTMPTMPTATFSLAALKSAASTAKE